MNTKLTVAACLFAALNVCTFAARAEAATQDTTTCGLVTSHITYKDSSGKTQMLDYLKAVDNCHNQNG